MKAGEEQGVDTVLVDTAGRLQNKSGLMDQLGKIKRVIEKEAPVTEVLLVINATTGQNGMVQAKVFGDIVDVTGIVLTKLDGTARGGIVVVSRRSSAFPSSSSAWVKARTTWRRSTRKHSWTRCWTNILILRREATCV